MSGEGGEELRRLKRDYLELDRRYHEDKELLIRVVQTLGAVVAANPEMTGQVESLKGLLRVEEPLDQDRIQEEMEAFKQGFLTLEDEPVPSMGPAEVRALHEQVLEACRVLRKIMAALLEDFYPLRPELEVRAAGVHLDCTEDVREIDLSGAAEPFLRFVEGLKENISEDFREINHTLFTLLEQVKELESSFAVEFGSESARVREIEYFEMKVNSEVGNIVRSFDLHTTVSEIKQAVIRKIENIKELVALRKQEETSRSERFQQSIESLKRRIQEVESNAREMSARAEEFQVAAMRDDLTGLYNRKAFDERVSQALEKFERDGTAFALILFDVDNFKEINDAFGHVAGDKVLQKIGQCLKDTFRKDDFIARYGGDEFIVLIEELSRDLAREKITSFLKNLHRLRFTSHSKGDITVSVSPGIALSRKGDTPEVLLERADRAMYDVKKRRR